MKKLIQFLFGGKITRMQFWLRIISFHLLGGFIFAVPIFIEVINEELNNAPVNSSMSILAVFSYSLGMLMVFFGWFTVFPKRLRDLGRSGWWTLGIFVPYIGLFLMTVYCGFFVSKRDKEIEIGQENYERVNEPAQPTDFQGRNT